MAKATLKRYCIAAMAVVVLLCATTFAGEKRFTVGVVVPTLSNPFWDIYLKFCEQGARQLGVDLVTVNADNKPDNQIKGLEDLAAQGVDGIIFTPYWETASRGLTIGMDYGQIPVALTDCFPEYPPQGARFPNYICFVGPKDEHAGYVMAKRLFESMKPNAKGEKVVGIINGTAGATVAIGRRRGFQKAIDETPGVRLAGEVNGDFLRETALAAFESLYQGHPDIAGVMCSNDEMATAAIAVVKGAGKVPGRDVLISGMDLNDNNVVQVRDGEQLFTEGGHWLQGGFALILLYDWLNGNRIPADEAYVELEMLAVTKDKVDQYEREFPGGIPKGFDFTKYSKTYTPTVGYASFSLKYSDQ